jgi:hypothetical protein
MLGKKSHRPQQSNPRERYIMPLFSILKYTAITLTATLAFSAALPIVSSHADHKFNGYKYDNKNYNGHKYKRNRYRRHHAYRGGENFIGAGILGLTLGAIIGNSYDWRSRRADDLYYELPTYVPPRYVAPYPDPYLREPEVVYDRRYDQRYDRRYDTDRRYRNENNYRQPTSIPEPRPARGYNNIYQSVPMTRQDNATVVAPEIVVPKVKAPKVITYDEAKVNSGPMDPWTPEWYSFCRAKYHSFNEKSGTYYGFDKKHHFCVAK